MRLGLVPVGSAAAQGARDARDDRHVPVAGGEPDADSGRGGDDTGDAAVGRAGAHRITFFPLCRSSHICQNQKQRDDYSRHKSHPY
jgi:hypothetical protein